ncbi:class I SAM-dependent methyltransferase [Candidatus Gottesmanbacteria bacterium]|nr:class I SAM-dependent methyltransferase [Candidatus Gottesmanbacteria bacterium]
MNTQLERDLAYQQSVYYERKFQFEPLESEGGLSRFEIFRLFSGLHVETADKIARQISRVTSNGRPVRITDIGAGDGEFQAHLVAALTEQGYQNPVEFIWIEPEEGFVRKLETVAKKLPFPFTARIFKGTWDDYSANEPQDFVIAAHLHYYFAPQQYTVLFGNMLETVRPGGRLFVVGREKRGDDDHKFIETFYERATGQPAREVFIDLLMNVFQVLRQAYTLRIEKRYARATITFPIPTAESSAIRLVEFYLRRPWESLDSELQNDIRDYLQDRYYKLREVDGIMIVTKLADSVSEKS